MATITRKIGPADHGQRMGLDEFITADFEEGWRYELARGVIQVVEIPGLPHGRMVGRLTQLFIVYLIAHPGVISYRAGGGECRLILPGMQSDRRPDQAVYLTPPPDDDDPWTEWVPQIVVEVLSEGSEQRELVEKREEYLRAGVMEYWILDPAARQMLVLKRAGDTWKEARIAADATYHTHLLPGLEVSPSQLIDGPAST
ncbi:MAG TPA: Uma2 family endonuclease [Isosphaeraceae bacterium]|jgi:Uma2 family endonuclease|nr:Uma2 family endonuclease [Isosphaeraceae bacterium]